jgi:hypothetical protein
VLREGGEDAPVAVADGSGGGLEGEVGGLGFETGVLGLEVRSRVGRFGSVVRKRGRKDRRSEGGRGILIGRGEWFGGCSVSVRIDKGLRRGSFRGRSVAPFGGSFGAPFGGIVRSEASALASMVPLGSAFRGGGEPGLAGGGGARSGGGMARVVDGEGLPVGPPSDAPSDPPREDLEEASPVPRDGGPEGEEEDRGVGVLRDLGELLDAPGEELPGGGVNPGVDEHAEPGDDAGIAEGVGELADLGMIEE